MAVGEALASPTIVQKTSRIQLWSAIDSAIALKQLQLFYSSLNLTPLRNYLLKPTY